MDRRVDYLPIAQFLPVENPDDDKWDRFTKDGMEAILYSLIAKLYVTEDLEIRVHRSFVNAMNEVIGRKAVRGHDYVIFSSLQQDGWYIHARIDRNFISPEDVINE